MLPEGWTSSFHRNSVVCWTCSWWTYSQTASCGCTWQTLAIALVEAVQSRLSSLCVYTYIYIYTYITYLHVYIYIYIYRERDRHINLNINISMIYIYIYIYTHTCVYTISLYVYVYIYIYICTCIHIIVLHSIILYSSLLGWDASNALPVCITTLFLYTHIHMHINNDT